MYETVMLTNRIFFFQSTLIVFIQCSPDCERNNSCDKIYVTKNEHKK